MASDLIGKLEKDYSFDPVMDPQIVYQPHEPGEKELIRAMFERAMLDLTGNNKKDIDSAQCWIFYQRDPRADIPFSFEWCCFHLSWEPEEVRNRFLIRLQKSKKGLYNLEETRRQKPYKLEIPA